MTGIAVGEMMMVVDEAIYENHNYDIIISNGQVTENSQGMGSVYINLWLTTFPRTESRDNHSAKAYWLVEKCDYSFKNSKRTDFDVKL